MKTTTQKLWILFFLTTSASCGPDLDKEDQIELGEIQLEESNEPSDETTQETNEPPLSGDDTDSSGNENLSYENLKKYLDEKVASGSIHGYSYQLFNSNDELLLDAEAGTCSSSVSFCPYGDQSFTAELETKIASSTKWVSSTVILAAVDELISSGRISSVQEGLSQTVGNVLGAKCTNKNIGRGKEVTLRQLLSFTSGLIPDHSCVKSSTLSKTECACQILAESAAVETDNPKETPASKLSHPPGTTYKYGSSHLTIAGAMIEIATGESFESIFQRLVASKINFSGTYTAGRSNNLAGGMKASTSEFVKFVRAMYHAGQNPNVPALISTEAQLEQESPQTSEQTEFLISPRRGFDYGLNIWRACYKPHTLADLEALTSETYPTLIDPNCSAVVQIGHGGKGGYTPFIDRKRGIYGVFAIREASPGGGAQYTQESTGLTTYVKLYSGLVADQKNEATIKNALPSKTLIDVPYGDHERQKLDVFLPKRTKGSALPVAMMVHGGGWFTGDKAAKKVIGYKKDYFHARGYAFVSINYRLAPDDMYPAAPNDVASSLAWLKEKKDKLNIDTSKVILIGHSAGAHLVNLVVTNGRFLSKVNFDRNHIKAFISLDTYFYDIKQSLGQGGARAKMILNFFGTSTQKMEDGSPLYFVDAKTPPMLNFNRISDAENISVRKQYISKIEGYGKLVSGKILVDYSHSQINELFGKPDDIMTNMSDKFLEKLDL